MIYAKIGTMAAEYVKVLWLRREPKIGERITFMRTWSGKRCHGIVGLIKELTPGNKLFYIELF